LYLINCHSFQLEEEPISHIDMEDEDVEDDYDIRDDQPDNFIDEGGQINLANDEAESDAIVA